MVRLIIGLKGSGKTKHLIELVNKAVETSPGHVACIEKGNNLIFDVKHQVRLIDGEEYGIKSGDELYALVCGIMSANYDIKDIFIDASMKFCGGNVEELTTLVKRLDSITTKHEINCIMTVSIANDALPEDLVKHIL